jgi:maltose alpha-D-glucosyltransferase/alpha-amylase
LKVFPVNVMSKIDADPAVQDDLWFKDAIIYQLHVKAFADSNGDGVGDFAGLTERLDYLQELGVNTLWLLPFYPSPGRDDGYDIADYRRINSDFGSMKDFRRFMTEAKRRGLRVITELVINHTSDQHPWFKRARRSKRGSDARNWYVWSDDDKKYDGTRIIFTDTEKSNWTWDAEAGQFFWHRFFSHQPDLNFDNPRVLWAIVQVMKRWLDMGVDGFRLDAIPYLVEREGTSSENLAETHTIIKKIREELDAYAPGRVLLAEANQWPEDVNAYFGDGDECHMAYHFPLMPRIYMAIAQEDRFPIADIVRQTPDIPENCQWALFLRNHDELTLEMVTDSERDYLWSTYAADPRARINLGIRRRLAPLMDNDRRKIELMNSLLLSLPGTPIIYYGDEIGMGDNIYLGDRNGVRTPMQWTPDRNGGFSRADPARLYLPCIMDPVYGFQAVNVEAQTRSLSSPLNWMKRLIGVRKSSKVFGRGTLTFIRPANRSVLAYVRQLDNEAILCVANLSRTAQAVELDMSAFKGRVPQEMLGRTRFPRIGELPYLVTLPPYGFFWFLLGDEAEPRSESPAWPREVTTLVLSQGWQSLLGGRDRIALERDVLPGFVAERRWFADKGTRPPKTEVQAAIPLEGNGASVLLMFLDVTGAQRTGRYLLPLTIGWARHDRLADAGPVVAAVRRGSREGALVEAATDAGFIALLLDKLHAGETVAGDGKSLEFRPTAAFKDMPAPVVEKVHGLNREQSNTTVIVGNDYVVKLIRGINEGVHPEIEIGRFLIDVAGYQNAPALLGSVELVEGDRRSALAAVHRFVENQGDAWTVTNAYLDRFIEQQNMLSTEALAETLEEASYLHRLRQIGRRTGELQQALASRDDIPDFAPEPITDADISSWTDRLAERTGQTFDLLQARRADLAEDNRTIVDLLLDQRDAVIARIRDMLPGRLDAVKIRHHGDFHLGQILIVKDDAYILDFEGEPKRPLAERRSKVPAARDIAGLLRSLDYAAVASLNRVTGQTPEQRASAMATLDAWRESAADTFWTSYRETLGDNRLWPADAEEARRLLDFFLLEKVFYEVEYELANRPDWINVPLQGVARILKLQEATRP